MTQTSSKNENTVFLGENVIQIAKMQSSVATNLHYFSILFYNKSQKWKILATLGLFWCMHSGYIAGCIQKSVDSSLCLIGLIVFLRSLMVLLENLKFSHWLKAFWYHFFLEISQPIHTLEAHVDGSFATKALLSSYGLSKRGQIFWKPIFIR